jgi:hypothetical protein
MSDDLLNDAITGEEPKIPSMISILASAGKILGIFLLILGIVIIIYEILDYWKIQKIKTWPIIPNGATIVSSFIESSTKSIDIHYFLISDVSFYDLYRNRCIFEYQYNGKLYTSTTMSYIEPWHADIGFVYQQNNYYLAGKQFDVMINPNDPSEAYIANYPYDDVFNIIGSILAVIAGAFLIYVSK